MALMAPTQAAPTPHHTDPDPDSELQEFAVFLPTEDRLEPRH